MSIVRDRNLLVSSLLPTCITRAANFDWVVQLSFPSSSFSFVPSSAIVFSKCFAALSVFHFHSVRLSCTQFYNAFHHSCIQSWWWNTLDDDLMENIIFCEIIKDLPLILIAGLKLLSRLAQCSCRWKLAIGDEKREREREREREKEKRHHYNIIHREGDERRGAIGERREKGRWGDEHL